MRQSVRLGRVVGIDIGAHWSVLVVAVLLAWGLSASVLPAGAPGRSGLAYVLAAIVIAVLFLAALLAHELSHALVARRFEVGVRRITLWLLGGVSELEREAPTPKAEFLIAAAGPLASLVIGGVFAAGTIAAQAAGTGRLIVSSLIWLAGVNVLLGVFNLLPGAPLDGGRIVRAIVWRLRHDAYRAQIAADHVGVVLGILLAAAGLLQTLVTGNFSGLWLVLLGWFLATAANAEIAGTRMTHALGGRRVRDIMATEPISGSADENIETFVSATAAGHPHESYPVLDHTGRPVGLVRLADLARIPPPERPRLPLRAAVVPGTAVPTVAADEEASAAARNLSPASPLLAVTDRDERLIGVVVTSDITHAIALARYGHPSPPDGRPDGGPHGRPDGGPDSEP